MKRTLSWILALCLLLTALPFTLAEDSEVPLDVIQVDENESIPAGDGDVIDLSALDPAAEEEDATGEAPSDDAPAAPENAEVEIPEGEAAEGEALPADGETDTDGTAPDLEALAEAQPTSEEADAPSDDDMPLSEASGTESVSCFLGASTDEDLFAGYASRILYSSSPRAARTMATNHAGEQLTGQDRAVYDSLKAQILKVAAGETSSTVFQVPVATILGKDTFTASEYKAMTSTGAFNWNINLIAEALWLDCTYELYWLDRYNENINATWPSQLFTKATDSATGETVYITLGKAASFYFPVMVKYDAGDGYSVNSGLIQSAKNAAARAEAIVKKYAGYTDYAKLLGYAKEICDLVDYNTAAAARLLDPAEEDPWKLIWVFDGDKTTNVVCEGYAQAYKYLCELTDFNSGIRCILVTGDVGGEGHSWNIVRMDDGKNYVVDVTWMDDDGDLSGLTGSMADWISQERGDLFLAGAGAGSVSGGYAIDYRTGGRVTSRTYWSATLNAYSASALTLASGKYVLTDFQRIDGHTYYFDDGHYVTGTRMLGDNYYSFSESGVLQGAITGWQTINGKRYFFESDGELHTIHTAVVDNSVAPTCTEKGLTEGSHCKVCGETIVAQEAVPATGHTVVTDPTVAPTCTASGLTEGSHCAVCKKVLVERKAVPAAGHTAVTDPAVAPTCTATGLTEGSHCAVCGLVFTAQTPVAPTGHTAVTDAAVAPTYTATGLTEGSHCMICGAVLEAQRVVPHLDHVVRMKKSATKTLNLGETLLIVITASSPAKSYKSGSKKIATVSSAGRVTAKKVGTARITITLKNRKKLTLTVKVVDPYAPKSVRIAQGKSASLAVGQQLSLTATLSPGKARSALKWSSSNKKVASVSSSGVVKAKKVGTATITVATANGKKATIKIRVKKK